MTGDIRTWSDDFRPAVEEILGPATDMAGAQARSSWTADRDGPSWSRCVVLFQQAEPVAVASAFHPRLHDHYESAWIEVAPPVRRRGLGTAALRALTAVLPHGHRPLRAQVTALSAGQFFAVDSGLRTLQRSRLVRVRVPMALGSVEHVEVMTPDDVDAVRAWRSFYEQGHHWDPPSGQPDAYWQRLLADGNQQIFGHRCPTSGRLNGFGQLFSDELGPTFIGGAVDRDDEDGLDTVRSLFTVAAQPTGSLLVELDDWMTEACSVVDTLDHEVVSDVRIVAQQFRGD